MFKQSKQSKLSSFFLKPKTQKKTNKKKVAVIGGATAVVFAAVWQGLGYLGREEA